MSRLASSWIGMGLLLTGMALTAQVPVPPSPAPAPMTSLMPQASPHPSPVAAFRRLLNMSGRERENYLTNRPPEVREALRAKFREYLAMDPDARELRLRATELRWQLIPLLRTPPTERAPLLAEVPPDLVQLVNSRLAEWDQLPPAVQTEFLANDSTLHYFAQVATTNQSAAEVATAAQHQKITDQFNQFFELTPDEKQRTLKTLSATERAQMEQALQAYGRLTAQQRRQCLQAFTQFASLSPAERAEFLKNAEHWAQMSPGERQTWRDLVVRVPSWPPMPANFSEPPMPPPLPPAQPGKSHAAMATNQN